MCVCESGVFTKRRASREREERERERKVLQTRVAQDVGDDVTDITITALTFHDRGQIALEILELTLVAARQTPAFAQHVKRGFPGHQARPVVVCLIQQHQHGAGSEVGCVARIVDAYGETLLWSQRTIPYDSRERLGQRVGRGHASEIDDERHGLPEKGVIQRRESRRIARIHLKLNGIVGRQVEQRACGEWVGRCRHRVCEKGIMRPVWKRETVVQQTP